MLMHLFFEPYRKWKTQAVVYLAQYKSDTGCVRLCSCVCVCVKSLLILIIMHDFSSWIK